MYPLVPQSDQTVNIFFNEFTQILIVQRDVCQPLTFSELSNED